MRPFESLHLRLSRLVARVTQDFPHYRIIKIFRLLAPEHSMILSRPVLYIPRRYLLSPFSVLGHHKHYACAGRHDEIFSFMIQGRKGGAGGDGMDLSVQTVATSTDRPYGNGHGRGQVNCSIN